MAILRVICCTLLTNGLLAGSAFAQDNGKPLDLTLPPPSKGFPAASGTSASPTSSNSASTAAPASANAALRAYYGDTGAAKVANVVADNPDDAIDSCDNKARVHGTVGAGVVASRHFSGNYQSGKVSITKPVGDCAHPTGGVSISVGVSQGRFGSMRASH